MSKKSKKILIILDIMAIVVTLFFIFRFSFQNVEESTYTSETVTDYVIKTVPPIKEAIVTEKITRNTLDGVIRSLAHASEFALLGIEMMFLLLLLPIRPLKFTVYLPFFVCLMLGVADESIQMLNDRASEVVDVVKDFAGAVLGGLFALLVYAVILRIRKKRP